MVLSYILYIVTVRIVTALLLLPLVATFVVAALFGESWVDYVLCAVFGLSLLALWINSSLPRAQTLVRAGVYPFFCGGVFPKTEEELRAEVKRIVEETGKPPVIVGSGWSFFLNRRAPARHRIYLQEFNQRVSDTTWESGVTAGAVCDQLRKTDRTLASRPTLDDITLGSWISANGHGNASTLSGGTSNTFQEVRVLDMLSDNVLTLPGKGAKKLFDGPGSYKYCILTCKLKPVYNGVLQMQGIEVRDTLSAAAWLSPTSQLRVLFLGAARTYGIGVLWNPSTEAELQVSHHINPHLCSRVCFYLQVDTFSALIGWHEPMNKYDGHSTLHNANKWSYWGWPLGLGFAQLGIVLSGLQNFEIFYVKQSLDGSYLWTLCQKLIALHKRFGGRCELRVATEGALNIVHVDMALSISKSKFVFDILFEMGVREAALHRGKRIDGVNNGRVKIVSVSALFENI